MPSHRSNDDEAVTVETEENALDEEAMPELDSLSIELINFPSVVDNRQASRPRDGPAVQDYERITYGGDDADTPAKFLVCSNCRQEMAESLGESMAKSNSEERFKDLLAELKLDDL